ncbi:hypothetical protein N7495_001702 [Penicillium taxi]|uniref:uncharacterized protein n=1 Tax=Penicillium taxi TaxID=168475 RepID=UPI002545B474|nr:uncharacterized protein N7495_001702 [Penicillium taxi]KAJ5909020.1 hypothetical protein N7495_001702 [Penicillium taxi]
MTDVFISPSEDLYLVMDCISTDLHYLIQLRKKPLEGQFVLFFTYQILRGLKYIHSAGVIHRDLKPSNILINENCDVKICDFGLARGKEQQMTGYITTRYYRAPEIMLTWQKYSYSMDIWSVGCILAEMLTRKVLFPGKDHVNQFELITELLGKPPKEVMEKVYSKETLEFVKSLPEPNNQLSSRLASRLGDVDPEAINLLEEMLDLDPQKRITAADALSHDYVSIYHDADDEPVFEKQLDWSLLESELSADEWKTNMYLEILDYHRGACDSTDKDSFAKLNMSSWIQNEMMVETY